jgi:thiamine-phosphate pyrophosphorylase
MRVRGFYGVIDATGEAARELAERLLLAGAQVLQVRLKGAPAGLVLDTARRVRALTHPAGVGLVVNDRLDVALAAQADAVHLGQADLPLAAARAALAITPGRLLIGVSTHTPAQAELAARSGADYLGFGPVFATTGKASPDPVQGLDALAEAVQRAAPVPVVAIGGITPARAEEVVRTGAAAACAISAVNRAEDVIEAARRLAEAFARR